MELRAPPGSDSNRERTEGWGRVDGGGGGGDDLLVWGWGETAGLEGTTWVPGLGLRHFLALEAGTHLQLLQMWEESDLPQGLW